MYVCTSRGVSQVCAWPGVWASRCTVWPHGDQLPCGVVHVVWKGHYTCRKVPHMKLPETRAGAPIHLLLQERLPQGPTEGQVLTRDCRMAWLVAFMQESSGKEHSPSQ